MLFSKSRTAENRLSDPTMNSQRLVNWLFMYGAILRYAEHNMRDIISGKDIKFADVLNFYKMHWPEDKNAAFLSDYLIAYYNERVERITKDIENGDKVSQWLIDGDAKYKFTYNKKSLFIN